MQDIKKKLRSYPWVDVPRHKDVEELLATQNLADTYYSRGSGDATRDLKALEEAHRLWVHEIVDLSKFNHCYFVNGTTDALHLWRLSDPGPWQKLCYGEYAYADLLGQEGNVISDPAPGQPLYISIPSAADGNIFDAGKTKAPVILDCTYVGCTKIKRINVPTNTEQVYFSFSKPFGLVGQRLGLVYTKEPHPVLETLKKFENWNYASVKTISMLIDRFDVDEMWNRHHEKQYEICDEYGFKPSDCFFLATTKDEYYKKRRRMKWNDDARICITPLFDERI